MEHKTVLEECYKVILLNAKTCLQQPDLYEGQELDKQFIDLYLENSGFLSGLYLFTFYPTIPTFNNPTENAFENFVR